MAWPNNDGELTFEWSESAGRVNSAPVTMRRDSGVIVSPYSRFFVRNLVSVRPYRKRGVPLMLRSEGDEADVVHVLQRAIVKGSAEITLANSDTVRITSCVVRERERVAVILFRRSDPAASTPFFEQPTTRALRKSDKKPDEAVAVSAHLFVSLDPIPNLENPMYKAIREEIPSLGRSYIEEVMQHVLREFVYTYNDRNGEENDTRDCWCKV